MEKLEKIKNSEQINNSSKVVAKQTKITTTNKDTKDAKDINYSTVNVYNLQKQIIDNVKLSNHIWKLPFQEHLVRDLIVLQQASLRQGTKKTKGRGEVSGGGRKPWKQKGTGRARHGSSRSPIWVGGGVTFGPTGKENYTKKMNRRLFRRGIAVILSRLLEEERIFFIKDEVDFQKPSSKEALTLLRNFIGIKEKILVILDQKHLNWYLSLRNLKNVSFIDVESLSPFALINVDKILFPSQGITKVEERLSF